MENKTCFTVRGKPFYSLGLQAHNYSSSNPRLMKYIWKAAEKIGANTVAIPVTWELFEPEEGEFNEKYVTNMILQAREKNLHLIFLWFGTWKNGTMEYVPCWIKKDTIRFPRVELKGGKKTHNLTPHCKINLEADKKAFCHLMKTIKSIDMEENTVIGVQIQNEAGILSATRRDFSRWGEEAFYSEVPMEVIDYCIAHPDSFIAKEWRKNGRRHHETWVETFGSIGSEWVTAWAIASYINEIACAGKKIYDIFLYTNAWLGEGRGIAGVDWPSGTPLIRNLDIYYAACTCLDTIAPDIYLQETTSYIHVLEQYTKDQKRFPLYVPESSRSIFNSGMMFEGIGNFGTIGWHVFGGESLLTDDQKELESLEGVSMYHSFRMLHKLISVLPKYSGTTKLHGIHRRGGESSALIRDLAGGWRAFISFTGTMDSFFRMDFMHKEACLEEINGNVGEPSRGFLIQESENVFYVVGHKFRVFFLQEESEDGTIDAATASTAVFPTNAEYLSIAEGYFDKEGVFVPETFRNGDEARHGIYMLSDVGVIRVELMKI